MSSAICFNLDQSKILSSGKELTRDAKQFWVAATCNQKPKTQWFFLSKGNNSFLINLPTSYSVTSLTYCHDSKEGWHTLTLSQTTNFRLFQTERVCRPPFSNLMKMAVTSPNGKKILWEKEKLLVTSNFSFSYSVFKRLVLQTCENQGLFGKGLKISKSARIFHWDILLYIKALFMLEWKRLVDLSQYFKLIGPKSSLQTTTQIAWMYKLRVASLARIRIFQNLYLFFCP